MRIRTLKPEFWQHEELASLDDFTRLMAIALLNWADDEGYFLATPALIRGSLFPFLNGEQKIEKGLLLLAEKGWIQLGSDQSGRKVGFVVNFTKHQRINRPVPSKIKASSVFTEDSLSPHGVLTEDSLLERKGKERKGREGSDESEAPPTLPFSSPEFFKAWEQWTKHRSELKKKLTPTAIAQQLAKMAEIGEERSIAMIEHSIANGWTGLFENSAKQEQPKRKYVPCC